MNPIDNNLLKVYYDSSIKEEYKLIVDKDFYAEKGSTAENYYEVLTCSIQDNESPLFDKAKISEIDKPLFQIAFYERELLISQYDNKLIRHAYTSAIIPPYALFHQTTFDNVDDEIIPIIHVFIDVDYDEMPSRFSRISGCSIWNYSICFKHDDYLPLIASLKDVIQLIEHNKCLGLYDLAIAQEYADLNARLAKQAYISFGYGELRKRLLNENSDSTEGNHGDRIAPFLFHSEREMREKIKKENSDNILSKQIKAYKWRFLLVDDKIDKNDVNGVLSSSNTESKLTKCQILEDRIRSIFYESENESANLTCRTYIYKKPNYDESWKYNDSEDIIIVCAENIKDATALMNNYEFDIILLDYLLGLDESGNQEYGYSLLKDKLHDLCDGASDKVQKLRNCGYKIGPQGKYFFMFISAFTTAISERLNVLGLSRNEEIWEIGEGACPTNTPELFKYRLVQLMKRRLNQTGIKDLTEKNILNTVKDIFIRQPDEDDKDWIKSVRERAYNNYHKVLGFHYDYSILRKNDKDHSLLVNSFLDKHAHLGAMLEHLLQLVHLTAFGTVRQWPEIWEEYKFFARTIKTESELLPDISEFSDQIESYIIALKNE